MTAPLANLHANLGLKAARRSVKRATAANQEANRDLARLEENIEKLRQQLAEFNIRLEVD